MAASTRLTYLLFFVLSTCVCKALVWCHNVTISNTTVSFLPDEPGTKISYDWDLGCIKWLGQPGTTVTFNFQGSDLTIKGSFEIDSTLTPVGLLYEVSIDDHRQDFQNNQLGALRPCDTIFFSRTGLDAERNHRFQLVFKFPGYFSLGYINYTLPTVPVTNISSSDSSEGSPVPTPSTTVSSSGQSTTSDRSPNVSGQSKDPADSGIWPSSPTPFQPITSATLPISNSSESSSSPASGPIPSSSGSSTFTSEAEIFSSSSGFTLPVASPSLSYPPPTSSQSLISDPLLTEVTATTEQSASNPSLTVSPTTTRLSTWSSQLASASTDNETHSDLPATKNDGGSLTSQDSPHSTPHLANSFPPESNPTPLPSTGVANSATPESNPIPHPSTGVTHVANSATPEPNPIPLSSGSAHVANPAIPESESATTLPSSVTPIGLSASDITLNPTNSPSKLDGTVLTPGPTPTTAAPLTLGSTSMISPSEDITSTVPLPSTLSSSPSFSIVNSTPDSVVSTKTTDAAPVGGTNTNNDSGHSEGHHRTATIVGGTVGAVTGSILLAGAAFAASRQEWLKYIWSSVGLVLGFGFVYSAHRFIFVGDPELPETRIALFITPLQAGDEKEKDLLVWNAFTVGPGQNDLILNVPCTTTGQPRFYFGKYQTRNNHVSCGIYAESPVVVKGSEGSEESRIIRDADSISPGRKGNQPIRATNHTNVPVPLVLGTGREISLDQDTLGLSPFMEVSTSQFGPGATYQLEEELYLHAFTAKNECQTGQLCKQTNEPDGMLQDRITKPGGIRLEQLRGLTTLVVKRGKGGKLELKIVRNKKEDVKKYQHECKIDSSALRQDVEGGEHENSDRIGSGSREPV